MQHFHRQKPCAKVKSKHFVRQPVICQTYAPFKVLAFSTQFVVPISQTRRDQTVTSGTLFSRRLIATMCFATKTTKSKMLHTDLVYLKGKGKGKSVPLQAWSGPEGSRKLRFPDFTTTAQDGGKVISLTHQPPLPPGNTPSTHFCWGAQWRSG